MYYQCSPKTPLCTWPTVWPCATPIFWVYPLARNIEVFANRGTSGIDGCTSTAVGAALAQPDRPVVLLTGDVAFFYDRNALLAQLPHAQLARCAVQ